ncbi:MAG: hypothetical protein ACRC5C_09875 [Bacilli bacterium]
MEQEQRKKVIIDEILFWKQSKLLPESYCDFLLTLYSEGDDAALRRKWNIPVRSMLLSMVLAMFLPYAVFTLLLPSLHTLPVSLSLICIMLYCVLLAVFMGRTRGLLFHAHVVVGTVVSLFIPVHPYVASFLPPLFFSGVYITQAMLWGTVGYLFRIPYLIGAAVVGGLLMMGWMLYPLFLS